MKKFSIDFEKLYNLRTVVKSWTLADVAEQCKVDLNHYHKIERGIKTSITPRLLGKIAKGFQIDAEEILAQNSEDSNKNQRIKTTNSRGQIDRKRLLRLYTMLKSFNKLVEDVRAEIEKILFDTTSIEEKTDK